MSDGPRRTHPIYDRNCRTVKRLRSFFFRARPRAFFPPGAISGVFREYMDRRPADQAGPFFPPAEPRLASTAFHTAFESVHMTRAGLRWFHASPEVRCNVPFSW